MVEKSPKKAAAAAKRRRRSVRQRTISVEAAALEDLRGQAHALSRSQAVIEFDLDGTVRSANENFLSLFGYTREELVGKNHTILLEPAYRDSAEYRAFWAKLCGGAFEAGRFKRVGKGGDEIWVRASYNPILDAAGHLRNIVAYASDIRPQVLREADSKAQAVIEFDLDGTIRSVNDNALRMLGYSLSELKGRNHAALIVPDQR